MLLNKLTEFLFFPILFILHESFPSYEEEEHFCNWREWLSIRLILYGYVVIYWRLNIRLMFHFLIRTVKCMVWTFLYEAHLLWSVVYIYPFQSTFVLLSYSWLQLPPHTKNKIRTYLCHTIRFSIFFILFVLIFRRNADKTQRQNFNHHPNSNANNGL